MQHIKSARAARAALRSSSSTSNSTMATAHAPRQLRALSLSLSSSASLSPITSIIPQRRANPTTSICSRSQTRFSSSSSSSPPSGAEPPTLRQTPLYDLHLAHGAKMVPFGGFAMPVQYADLSVGASHAWTRTRASLFDVGHMVQRVFVGAGAGAEAFLERVTPAGLASLREHRSTLSALMVPEGTGGIVDDTIVTRLGAGAFDGRFASESAGGGVFYVVTNAGCREKDDAYFEREIAKWNAEPDHADKQVAQHQLDGWGLVALQGPAAEAVLASILAENGKPNLRDLFFGQSVFARVKIPGGTATGVSSALHISRGGYTGEDGFEIAIPPSETVAVTEALLGGEDVRLAGLGARDSLRLEAGMCLYGHDLDETITPVEAGLSWIVPKERRGADAGFYGAAVVAAQLVPRTKGGAGVSRRRVGLVVEGAPAREHAELWSRAEGGEGEARAIGAVTSGCPSPTLGVNIAMGYVADGFHKAGTEVDVLVRGRKRKAVVTKMPFVPAKYWKGGN